MKIAGYALVLILLLFAQIHIVPYFAIGYFVPDILLIGIIVFGIRENGFWAMIAALFAGFFRDAFTTGPLGSTMLSLVIAAFLAGIFSRHRARLGIQGNLVFLFAIVLIYNFLYHFLQTLDARLSLLELLLQFAIPAAIYTLVVIGITYFLVPQGLWGKSSGQ